MYELDVHKDFCVCRVMLEVRTADAIRTHMSSRRLAITFCSYTYTSNSICLCNGMFYFAYMYNVHCIVVCLIERLI